MKIYDPFMKRVGHKILIYVFWRCDIDDTHQFLEVV